MAADLRAAGAALPTSFSDAVIVALGDCLRELITTHVRSRGLADPAKLTAAIEETTYPLAYDGSPVCVRVRVENDGPGQARDVEVELSESTLVEFDAPSRLLGHLPPGHETIEFRGKVVAAGTSDVALLKISWRDGGGGAREYEELLELRGQALLEPSWDWLAYMEPYPLDAVEDAESSRDAIRRWPVW